MANAILRRKQEAGNPHIRFDEGGAISARPRRGSLLYNALFRILALCAMTHLCICAFAEEGYYDAVEYVKGIGWQYRIEGDVVCIAGTVDDLTGDVTIPERIKNWKVVSIDGSAFDCNYDLVSISIPSSVTNIGFFAFRKCTGLKSISLNSNDIAIDQLAFWECSGLASVSLPEGYTMRDLYCSSSLCVKSITNVVFVAGMGRICDDALIDCYHVTSVVIPNSVTNIGDRAFQGCGIKSIVIPDGVTSIGWGAFEWNKFALIKIPSGVKDIQSYTFGNCDLVSVIIPPGVTNIGYGAFYDCNKLESVSIPPSVKLIGDEAFSRCGALVSVSLPEGYEMRDLYWGAYETITNVEIVAGTDNICENAFSGCSSLASIAIPSGVTNIGDNAFYECKALEEMNLPPTVKTIGEDAFLYCDGLRSVSIPAGYRFHSVYPNGQVTNVVIMPGTGCINDYDFYYCDEIASVSIPEGVTNIGKYAFGDCTKLTEITIPASTANVGDYAFQGCSGLTDVNILPGVMKFGQDVFGGCNKLASVTLPEGHSAQAFYRNSYATITNVIVQPGTGNIVEYALSSCQRVVSVAIPESVTNIGERAFCWCEKLADISIPMGVTRIEDETFRGCSALASVSIPSTVKIVGYGAFMDCISLDAISIPHGVQCIDEYSFSGCEGLGSVSIPSSVTNIGYWAFGGCPLDTVYVDMGDANRVWSLYSWPWGWKGKFVERPGVESDPGAKVNGDPTSGFVIRPSAERTEVVVKIPLDVDAAKVTVEVSPGVASVKPNGAKVKIVNGMDDITEYLNIPGTMGCEGGGVIATQEAINFTRATVKEEIVKEAMDVEKGAVIKLDAANPTLTTPNTRKGLYYQLREGEALDGMVDGDSTIGNGKPWSPFVKVKGGKAAFYSIEVRKGE